MEAVLKRMNLHGRVALCGLISGYTKETSGLRNLDILIVKRLKVEGFLIMDYASRFTAAATELGKWKMMGKLKDRQTVVEGLEKAPDAINMLFTGGNTGKLIVKV
jgi:NADPH-dependent curcumin reductase CurA